MKSLTKLFKNVLRIIAIVLVIIAIVYLILAVMYFAGALSLTQVGFLLPTLTLTAGNAGWLLLLTSVGSLAVAHVVDYDSASRATSSAVGGVAEAAGAVVRGAGSVLGAVVDSVASVVTSAVSRFLPLAALVGGYFLLRNRPTGGTPAKTPASKSVGDVPVTTDTRRDSRD